MSNNGFRINFEESKIFANEAGKKYPDSVGSSNIFANEAGKKYPDSVGSSNIFANEAGEKYPDSVGSSNIFANEAGKKLPGYKKLNIDKYEVPGHSGECKEYRLGPGLVKRKKKNV